jgi:hypothetical protein
MGLVLAIDPGNVQSAFVVYEPGAVNGIIWDRGIAPNEVVLDYIRDRIPRGNLKPGHLAIEMIASYGMPVGAEVFQTCVWIGRFVQAWCGPHTLVYRKDVKLHLCGQARAKDGNVRQALIDRYGGKDKAIGTKRQPGPLHGVKADVWSALAVAVTHANRADVLSPAQMQTCSTGNPVASDVSREMFHEEAQ